MRPERVELPTYGFVVRRSIQLSYGRKVKPHKYVTLENRGAMTALQDTEQAFRFAVQFIEIERLCHE